MITFLFFFYLFAMLAAEFCGVIMMDPFFYRAHRKGYHSPGWKGLITMPLWLGMIGAFAVFMYVILNVLTRVALSIAAILSPLLLIFLPVILGTGGTFLVLKLVPTRRSRISGSNRTKISFTSIGYGVLAFAGLIFVISLVSGVGLSLAIDLLVGALALLASMYYLDRRAKTPSVEDALWHDPRPRVIYLRSFDEEASRFATVSHEEAAQYSEITSYVNNAVVYNLTFEQFLARTIELTIGPFLALGNPTDYLPPEGAYRTYASDDNWQEYFTALSDRSAAILMQVGNSDNLGWELASIRQRGLQTRLFIVTPPPTVDKHALVNFFIRINYRLKGIQPATWERFATSLEKAGYPRSADPGPGAVLTFDGQGQALTLVTGATTPTEYVKTIYRQLQRPQKNEPADADSTATSSGVPVDEAAGGVDA